MMASPVAPQTTLADLIGAQAGAHGALPISDISLSSCSVQPGGLFIALAGERSHGLQYAGEAIGRGAAAILFEPSNRFEPPPDALAIPITGLREQLGSIAVRFFGAPGARQSLVGITGTNGKTTVAFLVATAMGGLGQRCGYLGTLGVGIPPELAPGMLTTPDCFTLHRALVDLYARSARYAALEVSSHALAQNRTAGVDFQTAVLTNLSRDHLDYHGDLESYGRSKASLFRGAQLQRAVINVDDAFGAQLAQDLAPELHVLQVTLERSPKRSVARRLEGRFTATATGLEIDYRGPWGDGVLRSPLIGAFNAENLLLALGVLTSWGIDHQRASDALGRCPAPPGRMETFRSAPAEGPLVVVDFAHSPGALEKVLRDLRRMTSGRLWCVFGCGGERDPGKRPLMGSVAGAAADCIVLTNDNPRSEAPADIVRQIRAGLGAHPAATVQLDRRKAIRDTIMAAGPEDTIVVAGRGHEAYQQIGNARLPLSDRAVVVQALGARS